MNKKTIKNFSLKENIKNAYHNIPKNKQLNDKMNDNYPNLKDYPFISCIRIETQESEESTTFFYVKKNEEITDSEFIKITQNILTESLVERPNFQYRESYCHEDLSLLLTLLNLCHKDILLVKECCIDWNLREFFIDTTQYYIYAEWETLA